MADAGNPPQQMQNVIVPADVQARFPILVELIRASESMNNEERQYWINILPVMTPDQTKNLEEILVNEKAQLAAIDAKYAGADAATPGVSQKKLEDIDAERRQKREKRVKAEKAHQQNEELAEESILKNIQNL